MSDRLEVHKGVKMPKGNKIRLVMKDGTETVHNVYDYKNEIKGVTLIFGDGTPEQFVDSTLIKQVRIALLEDNSNSMESINS